MKGICDLVRKIPRKTQVLLVGKDTTSKMEQKKMMNVTLYLSTEFRFMAVIATEIITKSLNLVNLNS